MTRILSFHNRSCKKRSLHHEIDAYNNFIFNNNFLFEIFKQGNYILVNLPEFVKASLSSIGNTAGNYRKKDENKKPIDEKKPEKKSIVRIPPRNSKAPIIIDVTERPSESLFREAKQSKVVNPNQPRRSSLGSQKNKPNQGNSAFAFLVSGIQK